MDKKAKEWCWLATYILYGMEKICHLSVEEISDITKKTDLINYLIENYPSLHIEGMGANLHGVQKFLKYYGIDISIDYSLLGKKGIPS